jgi:spermidine synthase
MATRSLLLRRGGGCALRAASRSALPSSVVTDTPAWAQPAGELLHRRLLDERSELGFTRLRGKGSTLLFTGESTLGNGTVSVAKFGPWLELFFDASEQGLSFVGSARDRDWRSGRALPAVLAFEYTRCFASTAAAFGSLQSQHHSHGERLTLCVGLGAGSLPAFLAHHGFRVVTVELDPLIIRVARDVLGVSFAEAPVDTSLSLLASRARPDDAPFTVLRGDAAVALSDYAAAVRSGKSEGADRLLLDAYEKSGSVPAHLKTPAFLESALSCLSPNGVLVCNLFNGRDGSLQRKELSDYASALRAASGEAGIRLYTVKVSAQQANVMLVAVKPGSPLDRLGSISRTAFAGAARAVALEQRWAFDGGKQVEVVFELRTDADGEEPGAPLCAGSEFREVVPDVSRLFFFPGFAPESSVMTGDEYVA